MNILLTGGCGYKGSVLVPKLLLAGHRVTVIDTQWFGSFLSPHPNLVNIKADIRDIADVPLNKVDVIIHLASVANDPCSDLDPKLTWEISALATMQLADAAVRAGVKQFVYASSGSVYGVKDEPQVTEDLTLLPISEYNKTKMVAERVVLSYSKEMIVQVIRPATVCGLSPRMRLDVAVNLLTMHALDKKVITVLGGEQIRPNIHIQDITDLYLYCLEKGEKIQGVYNAGFENISILDIANLVSKKTGATIEVLPSNDPRSYRLNSDKLLATGFRPKNSVEGAINEIVDAFTSGRLKNEPHFHNLNWMKKTIHNVARV